MQSTFSLTQNPRFGPEALLSCSAVENAPSHCLVLLVYSLLSLAEILEPEGPMKFLLVAGGIQCLAEPHLGLTLTGPL